MEHRIGWGPKVSEVLRKAFKVSLGEKRGPVHLEIPEDIMSLPADEEPMRPSDYAFQGLLKRPSPWPSR